MECPKCGDTTEGFRYLATVVEDQYESWDGEVLCVGEVEKSSDGNILTCAKCGAKFRRSTIEKLRAKEQL